MCCMFIQSTTEFLAQPAVFFFCGVCVVGCHFSGAFRLFFFKFIYVYVCVCHSTHVKVRGQFWGCGVFLSPSPFTWVLGIHLRLAGFGQQVLFSAKPSLQFPPYFETESLTGFQGLPIGLL